MFLEKNNTGLIKSALTPYVFMTFTSSSPATSISIYLLMKTSFSDFCN